MIKFRYILIAMLGIFGFLACNNDDSAPEKEPPSYNMTGFAKGADVSWLTEMEKAEYKFYNSEGKATECMTLLRDLGMNSIRLRVWVDPTDGWCNKEDMLIKAWRAHKLGMRLMIDFHYSDSWADPGKQTKPAAWATLPFEELKTAVANHTTEVLTALKELNISPEWVQVGNETGNGMLWVDGKASESMKNYAELSNAGYDAVKSVFPESKVIIHVQEGNKNDLYRWLFDGLKKNNAKWDIIGMSLYPSADNWQEMNNACIANMKDMIERYDTEVIVSEVGMPWDQAEACYNFLSDLITQSQAIENEKCLGVFYWEPQAYNSWKEYTLGAFDSSGQPTKALDAFKQ